LGFLTDAPAFGQPRFASFGATYFNTQIQNLIVAQFVPPASSTVINAGSAHLQGVETEFTLRPARFLTATLTYTYTQALNADTNSELLRRPQHSGSLNVVATPLPGLSIAPELIYTGRFQDYLVNNQGFATGDSVSSRPGLIVNLTVTYQVMPQIQLYASGRNLTNAQFEPVNGYTIPGANFLAGMRARF
ncbi:MAG: TonB-dependent receptor, partial [Acetobacteraceae bacterium]|nr:TonB-dependent receptor [Acetobacteraceae bacterium]